MRALQRGDTQAFDRLLERHLDSILRYLRRLSGSAADAEELSQETFMRLWTKAREFDPDKAQLTTWLHRIAHNLAIDRLRRQRPNESLSEANAGASAGEPEQVITDARLRWLDNALHHLPTSQSAALTLVYLQGFSNKEAATVMGIHLRALESLLARGKRALQRSAGDSTP